MPSPSILRANTGLPNWGESVGLSLPTVVLTCIAFGDALKRLTQCLHHRHIDDFRPVRRDRPTPAQWLFRKEFTNLDVKIHRLQFLRSCESVCFRCEVQVMN